MLNIPFFISPPYQVPPIICILSVRLNTTNTSEFSPCSFHLGLVTFEPFITTKSGSPKFFNSSSVGRINIFFTKWACQATSIIKRTFNLVSLFAPQNASTTYNRSLLESSFITNSFKSFHTSVVMARLTLPSHHTVLSVFASLTIYLSLGERPVNFPVFTATAPVLVTTASSKPLKDGSVSYLNKSSYDGL